MDIYYLQYQTSLFTQLTATSAAAARHEPHLTAFEEILYVLPNWSFADWFFKERFRTVVYIVIEHNEV